jgi:hypothetical protein
MRRTGLQVCLRDGRTVYAFLYSAGPFNRQTFADDVLDELEDLRRRMTATDRAAELGSESPAEFGSNAGSNAPRTVPGPVDGRGQ